MKKKFTRFLMLLAVAVTMGAFQSCKDANEDLYNKATLQAIADNASLQKALEQQIANLKAQVDQYQQMMDQLEMCSCDKTIPGTIASMQQTIESLQSQINSKGGDITNLENIVNQYKQSVENISNNYTTINNFITTNSVSKNELQDAINTLNQAIEDASKKCNCDFTEILDRLSKVEQAAADAKAKADAAMNKALEAVAAAGEAKTAAANAATAAQNAATAAQAAGVAAQNAQAAADNAKAIADAAKSLAETNKADIATNATSIKNIELKLVTMSDSLKTAYETAAAAKAATETNKALIDSLAKVTKATETALGSLSTTVTNLSTKVDTIEGDVTTLKTDVTNLKNDVTILYNKVDSLGQEIDDLKEEIIKLYAYSDQMLDKAKTYTDVEIALLKSQMADSIKDAVESVTGGSTLTIKDLKELIDQNATDISDLSDKYNDLKDQVDKNTIDITTLNGTVGQHTTDINTIKDQITTILGDITGIKTDVTDLKNADSKLNARIDSVVTKFNEYKTITDGRLDILGDSIYQNFSEILLLQTRVTAIENSYVTTTKFTATVDSICDLIDTNTAEIAAVKSAYQKADSIMQDEIDTLFAHVQDLEKRVAKNEENIDSLFGMVDAINELLAKQVTGIIIQATKNPLFGSVSAPFDVQSNVLLAYYGIPTNKVEFPTSRTGNYVRADEALTAADMAMINGVEIFESPSNTPLMYEEGFAGKIYMTINPNTADLEGLKLDIVNSQDEVSPIKLSPIKKSDEVLQFGITRAADNGFYESYAYLDASDIDKVNRPTIQASAAKDAIQEIVKNRTGASMSKIASDMYDVARGLHFDRTGLKCSYTENGNEHSVYSQYNLASTAFEPLSLVTLQDLDVKNIPGYKKADNLLNRISKKLKDEIHVVSKDVVGSTLADMVCNLTIKDIEVQDLTDDLLAKFVVKVDSTITLSGLSYHLTSLDNVQVPIKFTFDDKAHVKFDGDATLIIQDGSEIKTPIVNLKPSMTTEGGTATIKIPLKDAEGNPVYNSAHEQQFLEYDLSNIDFDYSSKDANGNVVLKVEGQTIGNIQYEDDVNIKFTVSDTIKTNIKVDKWFYFGDNGTDKKEFTFIIHYDMRQAAKELWGQAQDAIGGVNDMLDDVRDIVKEVNRLLDKVNKYEDKIDNTIDKYTDRIQNYLEKINSKTTSLINSANSRLQPVMIASTGNGIKRLSGSKNYPTVLGTNVTLYPTTWTMEVLVPLARKHVAVTNVFKGSASAQGGNADCKARLTAANTGDINKVVDGNVQSLSLNGLVAGYVYEVSYSGLDFHGKIATRKYYITVQN